jgi:lysophospholipase L1-like esterase
VSALAIIGDSITDGRGSDTDGNNRWPDALVARLQNSSSSNVAVLNQAAGGNRILLDILGPNALGRIDRDVLAQSGVRYAMIFEGVNDIGVAATDPATQQAIGDTLIQAFDQIITRVHAFGIPMFGATITPFSAPSPQDQAYSDPERERTRQRVNEWIRNSGRFDYVVDFDEVVRDPEQPDQLLAEFNSGDFLHPNVAAYEAMAAKIDLDVFERFAGGVSGFQ